MTQNETEQHIPEGLDADSEMGPDSNEGQSNERQRKEEDMSDKKSSESNEQKSNEDTVSKTAQGTDNPKANEELGQDKSENNDEQTNAKNATPNDELVQPLTNDESSADKSDKTKATKGKALNNITWLTKKRMIIFYLLSHWQLKTSQMGRYRAVSTSRCILHVLSFCAAVLLGDDAWAISRIMSNFLQESNFKINSINSLQYICHINFIHNIFQVFIVTYFSLTTCSGLFSMGENRP